MVELLAPAGSREALTAAVESGANAVYLAGNMFGARAYANNFDREALQEAIAFAHVRNVRVHVTVNTIVDDQEMEALADYLRFLYTAGADAVLVQDLGVVQLIREVAPDLPLHASTQMTVHNLAGVRALEALGFSRVVLSREVSLKDIRYICANSKAEIEVFVHGALCVCYSGQCLMSSMIGGRSGNRGRCAQPCRLPYTLVDQNGQDLLGDQAGKYLLSPRDLNTIEILPELIDAGVASLKIEGRMKRPEYVAVVVDTYRRAIDRFLSGDGYKVPERDHAHLSQIFNRDFTTAYLEKRPGRTMMSDRRPNNRGLLIGRVLRYDGENRRVFVKLSGPLHVGDQVDFWVKVGGRVAITVQQIQVDGKEQPAAGAGETVSFPLENMVREHDRVFKVFDAELMEQARGFFRSGAPVRRVPLRVRVTASIGEPLRIFLEDGDGFTAEAATAFIGEPAKKRPLTRETVEKQIARLGTTIFSLTGLETEILDAVMVPMSEINDARRRAIEALDAARLAVFQRAPLPAVHRAGGKTAGRAGKKMRPHLVVSVDSVEKALRAIAAGVDEVLFGGESYTHAFLSPADYRTVWQAARKKGCRIRFNTPRIVLEHHMKSFVNLLDSFADFLPDAVDVHNIGIFSLVKERLQVPIHVDFSLIAYNHRAIVFMQELGAASVTLSPELTMEQVEALAQRSPLPLECIVHGNLELMVSEYCVTGSFLGGLDAGPCTQPCTKAGIRYFLRDRKAVDFPLVMDQYCHMHVLNGKCLSMLPHVGELAAMGIEALRIEGKYMSAAELMDTIAVYQRGLAAKGRLLPEQVAEIQDWEGKEITRGHYFRGVL